MKNNIPRPSWLKIVAIFVFASLTITCKKDSSQPQPEISITKNFKIEKIGYDDFKKNVSPKTLGKLNYLFEGSDKLSSINIKDDSGIAPLIINIDSAKRITTNGHTSYIFSIKPTTPRAIAFKNLTIDESAEGTLAYITTYKPTREWIDAWRLGRYIEFKGDIKFELLNLNDLTINPLIYSV